MQDRQDEQGSFESLEQFLIAPTRTRIDETLICFASYLEAIHTRFDPQAATIYTQLKQYKKYIDFRFKGVANDCRNEPQWRDDFLIKWMGYYTVSARDWFDNDEEPLTQEDFALFLEKHMNDIVSAEDANDMSVFSYPTKAELYNFVTTLEDSKGQKFSRKVNVQNGDVSVSLERESDDGTKQRLKLFERFAINLQIYEGFPTYRVSAKLRFRVKDGGVVFFYDLEGLEELFNANRDWAAERIRELGFPVFI